MKPVRKRSPLTGRQQKLAVEYLPLAKNMAERVSRRFPEHRDDLFGAAFLGLSQAAESYDRANPAAFDTFAACRIQGAMKDVLRGVGLAGWKGKPDGPSLASLEECGGVRCESFGRVLVAEADAPVGEDVDELDAVESQLRWLPARHAEVCRAVFVRGETQQEVAGRMGLCKSYVSRLKHESLEILRSRMTPANA